MEAAPYFAVSEALTNVAKYAQASHASVRVELRDEHLEVTVQDDGLGGAAPGSGSGSQGLRDRLAALDGALEIDKPAGQGHDVQARLPA